MKFNKCTPIGEYECQNPMPISGRVHGVDACIADIVAALNAANITTVASCCGHGNESIARIDLSDGRTLRISGHTPKHEPDALVKYVLDRGLVSARKICKLKGCLLEDITAGI
jgi:hypothetical protein